MLRGSLALFIVCAVAILGTTNASHATPGDVAIFASSGICDLAADPPHCAASPSELYAIDPAGPEDVPIGTIRTSEGHQPPIGDIALAPNGELFGASFDDPSLLYSIDKDSAIATEVGATGAAFIDALTFHGDGRLFAATDDGTFLEVNTTTGVANVLGSYGPDFDSVGDLAFAPDGTLYGIVSGKGDQLGANFLARVNVDTGEATPVDAATPIGFRIVAGLAFVDGELLGFTSQAEGCASGALIDIDTVTGAGDFLRCLSFDAFGATAMVVVAPTEFFLPSRDLGGYFQFQCVKFNKRENKCLSWHLGVDRNAPEGDPVYAISDGIIEWYSNDICGFLALNPNLPGEAMLIKHFTTDGPFWALYGHIKNPSVTSGMVHAGQRIAEIGPFYRDQGDNYVVTHKACGGPREVTETYEKYLPHLHFGINIGARPPKHKLGYDSQPRDWVDPVEFMESHSAAPVP